MVMDPIQPSSTLPWYVAALWGVILVVGCYAMLTALLPRRRWRRPPLQPFRRLERFDAQRAQTGPEKDKVCHVPQSRGSRPAIGAQADDTEVAPSAGAGHSARRGGGGSYPGT